MTQAMRFILLLGLVSLFGDITYEGARSIIGPYLSLLGASATVVGFVVGLGDFFGYGLRVVFGYLSDKTRLYWSLTFFGYAVNLLAVPLLALAGSWQMAALLIILERTGKAIRSPARDTLLSYATKKTGRGWGFGIHESLDQVGALLGPLIVSAILFYHGDYQTSFAWLFIPAICALLTLAAARLSYPRPEKFEKSSPVLHTKGFSSHFWLYLIIVGLMAAGIAEFALISFHFQKASTVPGAWIPLFYSVAMAADGVAALLLGRWFDVKGISALIATTCLSAFFAPLVFLGGFYPALLGVVLWGIGFGAQESILRAVVADLVPTQKRGSAYGLLNLVFGLSLFIGSSIMGLLYDLSIPLLILFSILIQLGAIPLLLKLKLKSYN